MPAALRRPPLSGGGGGAGGTVSGGGGGVGPGRGPMMSAAAAAAGTGRGRALGAGAEPEPELEAGETGAAGGGHGDEPGLADTAPSQSVGPQGEPGRARADRSQQPRPPPRCPVPREGQAAPRAATAPFGVDLGAQGSGAESGPASRRAGRWGRLRGPGYGIRLGGGRGGGAGGGGCDRLGPWKGPRSLLT